MKLIGLTGGIATGKSTVSKMIQDLGLVVIDADILAREVVGSYSFGLKGLVQIFGKNILKKESQELDRSALGEILFKDPASRLVIENITHPLIQWRAQREFEVLRKRGEKLAFYDAALIFEKNLQKNFDGVLVVHVPHQIQIQRLLEREKITQDQAKVRIESQMPIASKMERAQFLIDNSETLAKTSAQVKVLIDSLKNS